MLIQILPLHVAGFIYLLLTIVFSEAVFRRRQCEVGDGKYKVCFLEQEEICHPLNKSTGLKVESLQNAAIIVKPFSPIYHGFERLDDKQCRFTIKSKKQDVGLFAVIQSMHLRSNEEGCLDYVKFRRKDKDEWSEKWCGSIDRQTSDSGIPQNSYSEYDSQGKLETHIFISSQPTDEVLSLSIVYTPNIKCSKVDHRYYHQVTNELCIWKDYVCDGYQNCAIEGCDDEKDCLRKLESDSTGAKVTVGAVTTIFLVFILFVTCLWICKKDKKLCWAADCAGPGMSRPSSVADLRGTPTSAPTAPMLGIAVPSGMQAKDLPPSYDSLFPEPSNTASS